MCVYKCAVDQPRSRRSLADDPKFLATLAALDRGLNGEEDAPVEQPEVPMSQAATVGPSGVRSASPQPQTATKATMATPATPATPTSGRARASTSATRAPLPPSITAPFDALTMGAPPAAEPERRRPLID